MLAPGRRAPDGTAAGRAARHAAQHPHGSRWHFGHPSA